MHIKPSDQIPDHWTIHHVDSADRFHIKSDNINLWLMHNLITYEAK